MKRKHKVFFLLMEHIKNVAVLKCMNFAQARDLRFQRSV